MATISETAVDVGVTTVTNYMDSVPVIEALEADILDFVSSFQQAHFQISDQGIAILGPEIPCNQATQIYERAVQWNCRNDFSHNGSVLLDQFLEKLKLVLQ